MWLVSFNVFAIWFVLWQTLLARAIKQTRSTTYGFTPKWDSLGMLVAGSYIARQFLVEILQFVGSLGAVYGCGFVRFYQSCTI